MSKKSERLHIRLDPSLKRMAQEKVEETQIPVSRVLREALKRWILEEKTEG